ncbi:hypothetical protein [Piscinibacter sakaiensis]|uniref:Conserved domain protein n=1 Tax=Piscinibacter sakaiensis TaxID=1547922 RepID=A0A0K8P150_PISS1|nr:hypothetical protein [Piscinibacter sakaiensis]GAP36264.1 conserved domain protein [Piscinibacter sakaiensis]
MPTRPALPFAPAPARLRAGATLRAAVRAVGASCAVVLLIGAAAVPADAQAHGRRGGGWHGPAYPGWGWGGVTLGIGLGALVLSRPWDPVIIERPTIVYAEPPMSAPQAVPPAPAPAPQPLPEPVIYPNLGQSATQTEADRQACNRWATTQPAAMADASVFHRATIACMEGRGYTVR